MQKFCNLLKISSYRFSSSYRWILYFDLKGNKIDSHHYCRYKFINITIQNSLSFLFYHTMSQIAALLFSLHCFLFILYLPFAALNACAAKERFEFQRETFIKVHQRGGIRYYKFIHVLAAERSFNLHVVHNKLHANGRQNDRCVLIGQMLFYSLFMSLLWGKSKFLKLLERMKKISSLIDSKIKFWQMNTFVTREYRKCNLDYWSFYSSLKTNVRSIDYTLAY